MCQTTYHATFATGLLNASSPGTHSNVIRNNKIYSNNPDILLYDGIGGQGDKSLHGFPGKNSDVTGNYIADFIDDGMQIEGGGENVRLSNNIIVGVVKPNRKGAQKPGSPPKIAASASALGISQITTGPLYSWNNVLTAKGGTIASSALKAQSDVNTPYKAVGAHFFFHNTITNWRGGYNSLGTGLRNVTSRNNIYQTAGGSIDNRLTGTRNSFDFDMVYSNSPGQQNGIRGQAAFTGDNFELAAGSKGINAGVRIPGFNDCFEGAAPDIGARESF